MVKAEIKAEQNGQTNRQRVKFTAAISGLWQLREEWSHLILLMSDSHLLFQNGRSSRLLFPHDPLLLQLWAPEALDAVGGRSQLTLLQVKLSPQNLILPLHLPELGLHLQQLATTAPHGLPEQSRGHPLVVVGVQHGEGAQVTVRQKVSMRQPHWSNIGAAAHGCDATPVHGPAGGATQSHGSLWVGGSGAHALVVTQVHGPWSSIGSVEWLDVLHGEGLAPCTTPAPTVCPSMAQSGGPWKARGPYRAALYMTYSSGTAVHVPWFRGVATRGSFNRGVLKWDCSDFFQPNMDDLFHVWMGGLGHINVRSEETGEKHLSDI